MRSGLPARRFLAGTLVAVILCGSVLPSAGPVVFTTPWDTIPKFRSNTDNCVGTPRRRVRVDRRQLERVVIVGP
jgi:hypothetical protein